MSDEADRHGTTRAPRQTPYHHLLRHESAVQPDVDSAGFNQLADALEDVAIIDKARRIS